jgi:hypothetical protein
MPRRMGPLGMYLSDAPPINKKEDTASSELVLLARNHPPNQDPFYFVRRNGILLLFYQL